MDSRARHFQGETLCVSAAPGSLLHASRFRAGERCDRHVHADPYVCVVIGGPVRERVGRHVSLDGPFTVVTHPRDEEHEDVFEGPGLCVNLTLPAVDDRVHPEWSHRRAFEHGHMLQLGLRLLRLYRRSGVDLSPLDLEELAGDFLVPASWPVDAAGVRRPLSVIAEQLRENPGATLGLSDYAKAVGLHPVYLARAFRKHFGLSVGLYQRHARVRQTVRLLTGTDLPISLVALEVGFVDQSHLTNVLKAVAGVTPGTLRRLVRRAGATQVRHIQDARVVVQQTVPDG